MASYKKTYKNSLLITLFVLLYTMGSTQELIWKYEYKTEQQSTPAYFWIDNTGNGYFNIMKTNPNIPGQFDRSHSLLILNKDGDYNGSVYIKQCGRGGLLLPYGDDQYIMSGIDCTKSKTSKKQTYLLDYNGRKLKTGKGMQGNYHYQTPSINGYTYFSKPLDRYKYSQLNISKVDHSFIITTESIPLSPLQKEGYGMAFGYIPPVQLENENWVIPFNYGEMLGAGISLDHGSIFCVKDKIIEWQYPDTLSSYNLTHIAANKNNVTLCMRKSRNYIPKLFVQLDRQGSVIQYTTFQPKNQNIVDIQTDNNYIILLHSSSISWYDWDGNLISEFNLSDHNIVGKSLKLLDNGDIVISASNLSFGVFLKISGIDENIESQETELDTSNTQIDVSYAEANLDTEEVLSVSVFPNPASIRINFELNDTKYTHSEFLLEVLDASGKQVFKDKFSLSRYDLNIDHYIAGTYFYRISSLGNKNKRFISGKFIKI